jgi:UDP-3-O-acyl-N-acetylglucosamine deacetylase
MGTSVGRWEGDTLVIQTAGFNGRTWLDTAQHPHSDALRLTIRMTRPDFDHLNWDLTMEDPKYYQKPIKNTRTFVLMEKGAELFEYSCSENNRCQGGNCEAADVQKNNK